MIELHWLIWLAAAVILAKGFYEIGRVTERQRQWLERYNEQARQHNDPGLEE